MLKTWLVFKQLLKSRHNEKLLTTARQRASALVYIQSLRTKSVAQLDYDYYEVARPPPFRGHMHCDNLCKFHLKIRTVTVETILKANIGPPCTAAAAAAAAVVVVVIAVAVTRNRVLCH
jgi:hypothetical protein